MTAISQRANLAQTLRMNRPDAVGSQAARGYYTDAKIQMSSSDGEQGVKDVDAKLKDAILAATKRQGDGRITTQDMKAILKTVTDGPLGMAAYSKGEAPLVRMLLAACDDRKNVTLDGQKIRVQDGAEKLIQTELPKFWGSIGGRTAAANRTASVTQSTLDVIGATQNNMPSGNIGGVGGANSVLATQIAAQSGPMNADKLEAALDEATTLPVAQPWGNRVTFMSEADYEVLPFQKDAAGVAMTPDSMLKAFGDDVLKHDATSHLDTSTLTAEVWDAADSKAFLQDLATPWDGMDASLLPDITAFAKVRNLLDDNVKDLTVVKFGEKDGNGLGDSMGGYVYMVFGKTEDNKLVGVQFGSVET